MQVTCTGCKSIYDITPEQVRSLSFSILPCTACNRFIKIAACPGCNAYYAITFSSAGRGSYHLTCERCARPFTIHFPVIREAKKAAGAPSSGAAGGRIFHFFKRRSGIHETRSSWRTAHTRAARAHLPGSRTQAPSSHPVSVTPGDVFALCGSAFTPLKLAAAAAAVVVSFLLMFGYDRLVGLVIQAGDAAPDMYTKSFLSIMPFALVFFMYIMAAAVIARITMDEDRPARGPRRLAFMVSRSIAPVFIASVILFLAADAVLILFGLIPVVGPFLFALAFLPVYAVSLCMIVLIAIGSWFYPPVIAGSPPGAVSPILGLLRFIRRHNFRLACVIPLMAMITGVAFAAAYLLHYGSFNLSLIMMKSILPEGGERIFSAIPAALLRLSDITIVGPDSSLFGSLAGDLNWPHTAAGTLMGLLFSLISIFLFALFISITATLSTRIYLMMESGADMDDASRLRILLFLVLMLAGLYLCKKLFL